MSSIKKCTNTKCNWEYPTVFEKNRCTFCNSLLNLQPCYRCKELRPIEEFRKRSYGVMGYCKKCELQYTKEYKHINKDKVNAWVTKYNNKRRNDADEELKEWLEITDIPFKVLSEEQWLETCRFFGGCALCGNEHIESRQFFINFKDGGKYTVWNMFPACSECSKHVRQVSNPFVWMHPIIGNAKVYLPKFDKTRQTNLLRYLEEQANRWRIAATRVPIKKVEDVE